MRSYLYFPVFLIALFLLTGTDVAAQNGDTASFFLKHYTDEDGLPQNSVKSIFQDEQGFVWLATEGGLARFDGANFDVFDKTNTPGLKNNRMAYICKTWDDKIYGLSEKYDFIRIAGGRTYLEQLKGTAGKDQPSDTLPPNPLQYWAKGMPDMVQEWEPADRCFVAMGKGQVAECRKDRVTFFQHSVPEKAVMLQAGNVRNFFLVEGGLYQYDGPGRFFSVTPQGVKPCLLIGDILQHQDYGETSPVQVFWNALSKSTLLYFDSSFYLLRSMPDGLLVTEFICKVSDINITRIRSSYYDEVHQRLFLGSHTKGLYVYTRKQFITLHDRDQRDLDAYYAQVPFRHNAILTSLLTVIGLDANGHTFVQKNQSPALSHYSMYTMARSASGKRIWVKSDSVLYQLDSQLRQQQKWVLPETIDVMYESGDSVLWIGTRDKKVFRMDIKVAECRPELVAENALTSCFQEGSNGDIWAGGPNGLRIFRGGKAPAITITVLGEKQVRSLLFQAPGLLWISTYGDGFYLYAGNKLTRFPEDKDDFLLTVHCMVPDNKGFLWLSTNKGLFQVSRNDLISFADGRQSEVYYYFYGKELGFGTNEFNGGCQPCAAKLSSGYISLPSLDGLVWFNPDKIVPELPDKGLFIDDITIDSVVQRHPPDTVRLPRVFNQLSIGVSTPYFGNRKNVQISYTLIGNDGKPTTAVLGMDGRVRLAALSSGTYRLILHKPDGFGKGTFSEKVLVLIIQPRFYETWWFLTLIAVLVLLTLFVYVRMRMLYVVKTNRRLELRIALRTRKLMNTLRALESSESILRRQAQIQEMLIAAISHDIKTPMKYLTIASEKMQGLLDKKDYESLPVFNKGINETASKMYILLDNLLQYIRVQLKKGDISIGPVNLYDVVQEKLLTFRNMAELHYTVINNAVPQDVSINSNRELLGVIVHNLIDNAVKNTLSGKIDISTDRFAKGVVLIIKDTGKGIAPDLAEWLNTPAGSQDIDMDTASGHMGMGLVIVKELSLMINARIQVDRPDTGGTRICITLLHHP